MTFAFDLKLAHEGTTIRTKITRGERRDEKATLNQCFSIWALRPTCDRRIFEMGLKFSLVLH